MKIIGKSGNECWIVDMTEDELAKILGFVDSYDSDCPKIDLGVALKIAKLWDNARETQEFYKTIKSNIGSLKTVSTKLIKRIEKKI